MLDDESDDDGSDDDGSDSGSAGMCDFPFCFDESVGRVGKYVGSVSGVGPGVLVLTGIESIGDVGEVFRLVVFVPIGVESKGGQLKEIFWRPKS